ncbi:uncharacterized protein JCM15063_005466 [Sporobolomyces koalae]|uniref:uncharacterized protein n=1 Tax=Sporobolomyces koalae TaxID=500713 RepID=UPI0031769A3D
MTAQPRLRPVSLEELSHGRLPSSFNSDSLIYRGTVSDLRRFNPATRIVSFCLSGVERDPGELRIEVRGECAQQLDAIIQPARTLVLRGKGGKLAAPNCGDTAQESPHARVVYKHEVAGFVLPDELPFRFVQPKRECENKRTKRVKLNSGGSASVPAQAPTPDVLANESTEAHSMNVDIVPELMPEPNQQAGMHQLDPQKKRKKPAKKTKSKDAKLAEATSTKRTKGRTASAPHEGSRSIKRRRQEANLDWSLTAPDKTAYSTLAQIQEPQGSSRYQSFAMVVVHTEVCPPRNPEAGLSLARTLVTDPSLARPYPDESPTSTVKLQWYDKDPRKIPKFEPKDILLVRRFYIPAGRSEIVRNAQTPPAYLVLKPPELLDPNILPSLVSRPFRHGPHLCLSEKELLHAVQLAKFYKKRSFKLDDLLNHPDSRTGTTITTKLGLSDLQSNTTPTAEHPVASTAKLQKLRRIQDIEPNLFCDVYGEILKCFVPASTRDPVSLYITDYTSHRDLMNYTLDSARSNSLVPGQKTLQVSIFGNQSNPFRKMSSDRQWMGHYVKLDNLRPKLNQFGLLECTLVDDYRFQEKQLVKIVRNDSGFFVKPILEIIQRRQKSSQQGQA